MDKSGNIFPVVKSPYRIGFLLLDGFALMSYASVVEPFRAANMLAGRQLYELRNYAMNANMVLSSNRAIVPSDGELSKAHDLDMLMLVAGGNSQDILNNPIHGELRRLDRQGVILGGVSGGPLLLAAAGLMEGQRMTIHWEHMEALEQISPHLLIERSLFVIDRYRVTCAGGMAPLDMAHSLIARRHGTSFAQKVSDWFLHTEIRPPKGAQRSGLVERYGSSNRIVLDAIELMQNHIGETLRLSEIANLAGISKRHINRLFLAEIGSSIMAFYLQLRLEHAERLLRNTSLSVTEIAHFVGFSGSAYFATAYKKKYGCTPSRKSGSGQSGKSLQKITI